MPYPQINTALDWLVSYLQGAAELTGLTIPNVWDGANFGVYRLLAPPLTITEVRVSYLSGRTHTGVIYVSTDAVAANWTSQTRKRFWFDKPITVSLYALYDGSEQNHEQLVAALNNALLREAVGTLGDYAVLAAPQPTGGELPDVNLRIQIVRTVLQTTFQGVIT